PKGMLPIGKEGKALNTDFETGDLRDWTVTGDVAKGQPVKGPINPKRKFGEGKVANHQGDFWLGGYEVLEDVPKGRLTSAAFKVSQPWAAFRLGGGALAETRVELVLVEGGKVFFTARGRNSDTMASVVVDLAAQKDKEIFIRIVDDSAEGWGHVNFDDFRFYPLRPVFVDELKPAPPLAPPDDVKHAGLTAAEVVKAATLPPGFKLHAFAAEPDVKQPIAFCIDDRGRLWVIENYTYPQRQPEGKGTDRIVVFEDTDGDHKFDKRTVFIEGLNLASAIEYGFGGVYVGAVPWLLHIPIKETATGPAPAGETVKLLEGFAWQDTHEMLNTFRWGPDGWLYGCHGVFTHSHVKGVGAPDSERQFINAGVWRYHPTKKRFEVFAEGTSNPWGIDFNEYGHCFIEACVIPHLFHMIQGGRYQRQGGQHYTPSLEETKRIVPDYFAQDFAKPGKQPINPFIYDDIKTIADHRHYTGGNAHAGNARSDAAGGGHAHAGLMCYLGGSWPKEYHGKLVMGNIHGQRLNVDSPERKGSGYVGKHAPDFLNFNDKWSQTLDQRYDQDGNVFIIDWYDKQQCHTGNAAAHDRSNGRIYKIVYGDKKGTQIDLAKLDADGLIPLLGHANEFQRRHAQRLIQERGGNPALNDIARKVLSIPGALPTNTYATVLPKWIVGVTETRFQLRCLWSLHVTGALDEPTRALALRHPDEHLRAWTIQLLCEDKNPGMTALAEFARMAREDASPLVRLYLASACQRLTVAQRTPIMEALLAHAEDAADPNLPLMYWYAAEPIAAESPAKAVALLAKAKIPIVREYITRRLAARGAAAAPKLRIVTLGDSITKGVRTGVSAEETFAALLESGLRKDDIESEVINVGIGGERTDQALLRLAKDVVARNPSLVTIMYGTNDSYVDAGKSDSRLTVGEYRANLEKLVDELRAAGVAPVLMTEPRWGRSATLNGAGEHPNLRLEKFVQACRAVAVEKKVPLVDHFQIWTEVEARGTNLGTWTTDQCHPNPKGHRSLADAMLPVVRAAIPSRK
ncbi:MAG: hypothetical protein EXS29_08350, partial [Pedosphaera sp.]|nr:hypothetical protein [Pedosphaera sp.]